MYLRWPIFVDHVGPFFKGKDVRDLDRIITLHDVVSPSKSSATVPSSADFTHGQASGVVPSADTWAAALLVGRAVAAKSAKIIHLIPVPTR